MLVALVTEGFVVSVQNLTDEQIQSIGNQYAAIVDVTGVSPTPVPGWSFDGSNVNPPTGTSTKLITKLAMLQRFTVPERLGILSYTASNPSSVPAILLQNIVVATYVDLSRPDTQAGINYLVNFGLLTSGRANTILTAPPTAIELYKG